MNHHQAVRRSVLAVLPALVLGLAAPPARADAHCKAPVDRWQSREAVRQMATREGWQIQRLKIDDGCYEIRGIDAQGHTFKAKIDPETLKVLKMKQRARARDRDGSAAPQPPPPDGSSPRSESK